MHTGRQERLHHDLRQALCAVRLLVAVSQRSTDRAEVLRRLDQIRDETEWMTKLLASGAVEEPHDEVIDIGDVVYEAWHRVSATAECDLMLIRESSTAAQVDRLQAGRVMRNLLDNAARAAGTGGRVHVRVFQQDGHTVTEIANSGPSWGGIPRQQGLGMVTVRGFVDRYHGTVTVQDSAESGVRVTLRLPAIQPAIQPGSRPAKARHAARAV